MSLEIYSHHIQISSPTTRVEADYNMWYAEDHLDLLSKLPEFLRARRFKLVARVELSWKATSRQARINILLYAPGVHGEPGSQSHFCHTLVGDND